MSDPNREYEKLRRVILVGGPAAMLSEHAMKSGESLAGIEMADDDLEKELNKLKEEQSVYWEAEKTRLSGRAMEQQKQAISDIYHHIYEGPKRKPAGNNRAYSTGNRKKNKAQKAARKMNRK